MFGLGAYASSSSGDEAENVKVDEAPPAASPESLFANDPRVPKEPAGEVDPATVAHWQKTVSASGSALEALLKDKYVTMLLESLQVIFNSGRGTGPSKIQGSSPLR